MQAVLNEKGFVLSFAFIGNLVDSVEVPDPDPDEMDRFMEKFYCYQLCNGKLVFSDDAYEAQLLEELQTEYRQRREAECFSIINRGQLWYETLTDPRKAELREWYLAWLDGTPTQAVPDRPAWLE